MAPTADQRLESGALAESGRRPVNGLAAVVLAVLAYSTLHVGFRLWASSVLGEDDVYDNILAQDLRLGYEASQPPLYNWVLWTVQQFTGPTLESFLLIKYAALIATAAFLYLAALRILGSRIWAFLTVESLALIYQISWRYHEGFTHQVLAMVAVAATLWAFLRVIDHARIRDFIVLGIAAGLGALTQPSYCVYLLCLLLAAALQPAIRARVLSAPLLITFAIGSAIVSPFLWWVASEPARVNEIVRAARAPWSQVLRGIFDALRGPILYLSPLIFFLPFVFRGFLRVACADLIRKPNQTPEPDLAQFVLHAALWAILLSLVGALVFGIGGYAVHSLMPLYVTSVVWLFSAALRGGGGEAGIGRFTQLALTIAVIALLVRLANMFVLDPVCKTCRWGVPYPALAADLREHGFEDGTIIAFEHPLAGNLRQLFPKAQLVTRRYPNFTPATADLSRRPMVLVWSGEFPPAYVERFLGPLLPPGHSFAEARRVAIPWKHLWKPDGYRVSDWRVLLIE